MQPASTIRKWQYEQLGWSPGMVRRLFASVSEADLTTYRDGGDGWTALEVLGHLSDWDDLFLKRLSVTVEEDQPPIPNRNPDEAAAEGRYNEQDIAQALAAWEQKRQKFLAYVTSLGEEAWEREALHPTRGTMSLMDQLLLMVWHDHNHIAQMVKILNERKS